ncbi:hypothetical protein [Gordonia polyisoprenivorans]|uniref:hypothetical protein n=1 Tax=Gordonia polyisoprenivorans TaxID=84595 RepID=UPI001055F138|nr:hypothetical protein [Gordonia polyisoprenivorans]UZF57650.1 hypothetical protein LH935_06600 [Gordonia polyisoprenivorans]
MKLITHPRIRHLTLAFIGAGVLATAIYQKIMQYPDSAQGLADALAISPSDRADHWAEVHPLDADNRQIFLGVHGWSEAERNAAEAAIDQAAETCQA